MGVTNQSTVTIIRDHSQNITWGGGIISIFDSKIWVSPSPSEVWQNRGVPLSEDWQNLSTSHINVHYVFLKHLYMTVFYVLIWAISVFLVISIWQNLSAPPNLRRLAKFGSSLPPPNGKICPPSFQLHPSNVFWTVPYICHIIYLFSKKIIYSMWKAYPLDVSGHCHYILHRKWGNVKTLFVKQHFWSKYVVDIIANLPNFGFNHIQLEVST